MAVTKRLTAAPSLNHSRAKQIPAGRDRAYAHASPVCTTNFAPLRTKRSTRSISVSSTAHVRTLLVPILRTDARHTQQSRRKGSR